MLFNPQDALPLPPRPNVEPFRKLAEDLAKSSETGALSEAQLVVARSHGFGSWTKLVDHIQDLARESSPIAKFEQAADAIVTGDAKTLERLLRESPELARARSTREHDATLLHYVSANGVENYRQMSPKNIVTIAELLLDAGAEVDAEADVYGGGATTLGLVATSVHPEKAGVQNALMQMLLDHGAAIGDRAVRDCLANGRAQAAEFLVERGAALTLETAAGVGRLDLVESLFPDATDEERSSGFLWACGYGRNDVAGYLLARGANLAAPDVDGQTPLHHAVLGGQLETVKLLLERYPPLAVKNVYGGTVLGQAYWSAANGGDPDLYAAIIETLVAAGAE